MIVPFASVTVVPPPTAVIVHEVEAVSTSVAPASRSPVIVFCGPVGSGAPSVGSFTTRAVLPMAAFVLLKVKSAATGASLVGTTVTTVETVGEPVLSLPLAPPLAPLSVSDVTLIVCVVAVGVLSLLLYARLSTSV